MAGELKLKDVKLEVFCPNCHGYEEYKDGKCAWCGFNHIRKLSVKEREVGWYAHGICSFVRAERAMEITDGLTTLLVLKVRHTKDDVDWWVMKERIVETGGITPKELRREVLHITPDFDNLLSFLQRRLEVTEGVRWGGVTEREVLKEHPERWWETITVIERVRRGEVVNRKPTKEELAKLLSPLLEGGE